MIREARAAAVRLGGIAVVVASTAFTHAAAAQPATSAPPAVAEPTVPTVNVPVPSAARPSATPATSGMSGGARRSVQAGPPQSPLVFVMDPKLGMEAGVRTFDSLGRVLFRYDEALPVIVPFDEKRALGRLGAIVARTAQWLFIDDALAEFQTTAIHEVFGHGSRARDVGQKAQFDFALPGIYCAILADGSCTSHAQVSAATGNRDRDLLVLAGGTESNHVTAFWIETRVLQARGWVHQGDLLVYASSKLAYAPSLLSPKLDTLGAMAPGDDMSNYVTALQDRFDLPRPDDRHRVSSRLRTAYLWNFADPMLMYAAYGVFYRGIGRGERWTQAPLPKLGGTSFLVTPRFGLTPFGAEHYVDVFLARGSSVLALYGRAGSSGLASYAGAGARAVGVRVHDRLALGGELDVWSQPETLLDDRAVYTRPQRAGLNVGITADLRLFGRLGLLARLAYKTRGFVSGQPIDDGVHGYVGASLALDAAAPR